MAGKKYKVSGIIRSVDKKSGASQKGEWVRAGITIEKADGHKTTVSTFDSEDTAIADGANGKQVEAIYELNGKYKNLTKRGLKVIGQGEAPITDVDVIDEGETIEEEPSVPVSQARSQNSDNGGYWAEKLAFDKTQAQERQNSIVRQNSWSQAQTYITNMLKAVELGIIPKDQVKAEDLKVEAVQKLAHSIENDINDPKRVADLK